MTLRTRIILVLGMMVGGTVGAAVQAHADTGTVWCQASTNDKCYSDCNGGPGTDCFMANWKNQA
ncbi:MAG TPA: hypothetical protein VGM20_07195 [Gemmatimonadales bacterium]|jgi:hypothetical protein